VVYHDGFVMLLYWVVVAFCSMIDWAVRASWAARRQMATVQKTVMPRRKRMTGFRFENDIGGQVHTHLDQLWNGGSIGAIRLEIG
jgi:predicted Rdx family selenoprotein